MKTIDFVYAGIIITLVVIAIIAFRTAIKNDKRIDEEDNSDLSNVDFEESERPWISQPFDYN
jgi:hypothetical protein